MEHNKGAWGGRARGRVRTPERSPERNETPSKRARTGSASRGHDRTRGAREGSNGRRRETPRGSSQRGRGAQRGIRCNEQYDVVVSRTITAEGTPTPKQAIVRKDDGCTDVRLIGNYFQAYHLPNWHVYHYHVDYKPDQDNTRRRKELISDHSRFLGGYIFDGASLFVAHRLEPDPLYLNSTRDRDGIEMSVKLVGELSPTDVEYLQILNILIRTCLQVMSLEEINRNFFDYKSAVQIPEHKLELWPGFRTCLRNRENNILLEVELATKVIRKDNCCQVIKDRKLAGCNDKRIKSELVNTVVMTTFNRKTYKVNDIDFTLNPKSTFDYKGRQISFTEYYKERYNITIESGSQPLLVSLPKKRDFHRGQVGPILLVPELCRMTGLTDSMRQNHNLMRALASHMNLDPERRKQKLNEFICKLQSLPAIQRDLDKWGLKFQNRMVEFPGHTFPTQRIVLGNGATETPNSSCDWGHAFRTKAMLSTVALRTWTLIVPSKDAHVVEKLNTNMQRVSKPLHFSLSPPSDIIRLSDPLPMDYARAVDTAMNKHGDKMQMIFAILPKQEADTYQAVKKRTCLEFGVPSQCFVAKNASNEKSLMSICTKVVVQMNAKLGGEPWSLKIPLTNIMVVGFDVHHSGKDSRGPSVGAMVATTSSTMAKYFGCISTHSSREEVSEKMGINFTKCLNAYQKANKMLPDRIIMYRDGVGEGQLKYVHETEIKTIKAAIKSVYQSVGAGPPKFGFIVVSKRINTRIFNNVNGRLSNPCPGTAVDDVITLPERYDFYLISQFARSGTVSPVSYNVLHDTMSLPPDRVQMLTFKLCHLYFNWSGTVKVPAPCQYARKLAYLTGVSLGGSSAAHEKLVNSLYYL